MQQLLQLVGTWTGQGSGDYPSIDGFSYTETLRFEADPQRTLLHYEQRTFLQPSGDATHWESGFLRVLDDGTIELSSAQSGGRVEVMSGQLVPTPGGFVLMLQSILHGNDPRLVSTSRVFTLAGAKLDYTMSMQTQSHTDLHLTASLVRSM